MPDLVKADVVMEDLLIADEVELESFCRKPVHERVLTSALRGVLAETATTGIVRYKWSLLRPLVELAMEQVIRDFDTQTQEDVGPSRYASYGETVNQTLDRFKTMLSAFSQAPWTLQRLCEVVLEPKVQYRLLHKVTMAIEKCLLVTGEVAPCALPPPPPPLSQLGPVNVNPPPIYQSMHGDAEHGTTIVGRHHADMDDEVSSAFMDSMMEVRAAAGSSPPAGPGGQSKAGLAHNSYHSSNHMEHIEEDHWPDVKAAGLSPLSHHQSPTHLGSSPTHHSHSPPQSPSLPTPHSLLASIPPAAHHVKSAVPLSVVKEAD
ncbi:hypothetical protein CEUSTIGMA_g2535.t1 [Chlamydomonas eustigma]|uniref:Uncharacterized protein n=1 Tax=Chlamydomonas eustigma TaxID=1157962 RepID=A0A250WW99_9CHLO|nr:hypothetical protein CEUSTIGMA_g2535.t1 [Chlamydomonas eustigma]|eukprot:GAX75091.1 hypothetical protein CEUSTIGMA_g2535.t1 [Chlamydomonas eustigma]